MDRMYKKMIAIDLIPNEGRAQAYGFHYFPLEEFVNYYKEECDVLETLVTLQRRVPENDSPEAIAEVSQNFERKRYALEMKGAKVIECPSKRSRNSPSGYKQSDDQKLVVKTLTMALKLRPDYVVLVASDGDYAPMVEALREEGIRTEVVAFSDMLASDLRRQAFAITDLGQIFDAIRDDVYDGELPAPKRPLPPGGAQPPPMQP
jgi:uncharacterized LabA/DUF88 family protein